MKISLAGRPTLLAFLYSSFHEVSMRDDSVYSNSDKILSKSGILVTGAELPLVPKVGSETGEEDRLMDSAGSVKSKISIWEESVGLIGRKVKDGTAGRVGSNA